MTALAHAHHDHPAPAGQHRGHGSRKAGALPSSQAQQRPGFDLEGAGRELQRTVGVEVRGGGHGHQGVAGTRLARDLFT